MKLENISIEPIFQSLLQSLQPLFGEAKWNVAEENLQARVRGTLLMAYSNKLGHLLLSTGNKSELAVGYCTLYGDLTGGLAVISDLYKTQVYALCSKLNQLAGKELIPASIMQRAPSAELRDNQTDQETLPPYEQLDNILRLWIEERLDPTTINKMTGDSAVVARVMRMVEGSEFKRRQAPLGLKVSKRAFGQGRRLPIVHR